MPATAYKYTVSEEGIIEAHEASALPPEGENGRGLLHSKETVVQAAIISVQKARERPKTANSKETLYAYLLRLVKEPEMVLTEAETATRTRKKRN